MSKIILKNEADWYKKLKLQLSRYNFSCTRIESRTTGVGIPDLFVQGYGFDVWIELKFQKTTSIRTNVKVKWRPGQQAWLYNYYLSHNKTKNCITLVATEEGVVLVPHTKIYTNDVVPIEQSSMSSWLWKDWQCLNLPKVLKEYSEGAKND